MHNQACCALYTKEHSHKRCKKKSVKPAGEKLFIEKKKKLPRPKFPFFFFFNY